MTEETRKARMKVEVCGEEPPRPGAPGPAPGRLAIVVAHGMGRPVPFQTLEDVAISLWDATARADLPSPEIRVTKAPVANQVLPRAELKFQLGPSLTREVHLYEAYWAPIPKGKVRFRDVVVFLLTAAYQNLRNAHTVRFSRHMFGSVFEFAIPWATNALWFATAAGVVLALMVINFAVGLVVTAAGLGGGASSWVTPALVSVLRTDVLWLVPCVAALALGVHVVPGLWRSPAPDPEVGEPRLAPESRVGWALVVLGLAGVVAVGTAMLLHLLGVGIDEQADLLEPINVASLFLFWAIPLLTLAAARGILVMYVGDVAAYVSAHAVNSFWEVRQDVFTASTRVARAVYQARTPAGDQFAYDEVVLVGHSLGSVVAYDTLNGMLLEDLQQRATGQPTCEVAQRTAMLLTFGSPLDKIAFVFRIQKPEHAVLREVLAEAVQPLIHDPRFRPRRWVNIYSPNDPISGRLDFFEPPETSFPAREKPAWCVENIVDHEATRPLLAHVQYWRTPRMGEVLLEAVARRPAQAVHRRSRGKPPRLKVLRPRRLRIRSEDLAHESEEGSQGGS